MPPTSAPGLPRPEFSYVIDCAMFDSIRRLAARGRSGPTPRTGTLCPMNGRVENSAPPGGISAVSQATGISRPANGKGGRNWRSHRPSGCADSAPGGGRIKAKQEDLTLDRKAWGTPRRGERALGYCENVEEVKILPLACCCQEDGSGPGDTYVHAAPGAAANSNIWREMTRWAAGWDMMAPRASRRPLGYLARNAPV